ncbi:MAG: hypothetical protein IKP00_01005 [Victivallales bacterium]|nr:hypothetical protein [Victivallales bacterium]
MFNLHYSQRYFVDLGYCAKYVDDNNGIGVEASFTNPARKLSRIRIGTRQTLLMSLMLTLFISVLVWTFEEEIVAICGLGGEAGGYCLRHLSAVALINIVLSVYIPLFGVFQGTGHSGVPAIVAIGALGMRVLVTYLFRYSAFLGSSVIWWNGIFGFGTGFLISWSYYLAGHWMQQKPSNRK